MAEQGPSATSSWGKLFGSASATPLPDSPDGGTNVTHNGVQLMPSRGSGQKRPPLPYDCGSNGAPGQPGGSGALYAWSQRQQAGATPVTAGSATPGSSSRESPFVTPGSSAGAGSGPLRSGEPDQTPTRTSTSGNPTPSSLMGSLHLTPNYKRSDVHPKRLRFPLEDGAAAPLVQGPGAPQQPTTQQQHGGSMAASAQPAAGPMQHAPGIATPSNCAHHAVYAAGSNIPGHVQPAGLPTWAPAGGVHAPGAAHPRAAGNTSSAQNMQQQQQQLQGGPMTMPDPLHGSMQQPWTTQQQQPPSFKPGVDGIRCAPASLERLF